MSLKEDEFLIKQVPCGKCLASLWDCENERHNSKCPICSFENFLKWQVFYHVQKAHPEYLKQYENGIKQNEYAELWLEVLK